MKVVSASNKMLRGVGLLLIGLLQWEPAAAGVFNAVYESSSGVFPEQVCPYTPFDSASPENPALSGGKLIISTSANSENIFYIQSTPDIVVPDPLIIEARMKFVSGSTSFPTRAAGLIAFTSSTNIGGIFLIGEDEIFVDANGVRGDSAVVDTNDAFHTYRIEASGLTGVIKVFYDDVLTLTDSTFANAGAHGPFERVFWGEGSSFAFGITEWEFVRHNAGAVACGVVPFANFLLNKGGVIFMTNPAVNDELTVEGELTLGLGNDGINLATDDVIVTVGTASLRIPAGSFLAVGPTFEFDGDLSGVDVKMTIEEIGLDTFKFKVEASDVDLIDISNPVEIGLQIGSDLGTAEARLDGKLKLK